MKVQGLTLALLPLLAAASPVGVGSIHSDAAPILSSTNANEIPDSYLVVFKKHVNSDAAADHHSWVQDIHKTSQLTKKRSWLGWETAYRGMKHTFDLGGSFMGYSGHFSDDVIEQVRRHPDVSLRDMSAVSFSSVS